MAEVRDSDADAIDEIVLKMWHGGNGGITGNDMRQLIGISKRIRSTRSHQKMVMEHFRRLDCHRKYVKRMRRKLRQRTLQLQHFQDVERGRSIVDRAMTSLFYHLGKTDGAALRVPEKKRRKSGQ